VYRVLQEALSNSYKDASGAKRSVSLSVAAGDLVLNVEDDGPGFDPLAESRTDALGLDGMRERVEMLGGSFEIDSRRGTRISVRIPIDGAPHE
jgi:two-component system sensor histidine kinase DegS